MVFSVSLFWEIFHCFYLVVPEFTWQTSSAFDLIPFVISIITTVFIWKQKFVYFFLFLRSIIRCWSFFKCVQWTNTFGVRYCDRIKSIQARKHMFQWFGGSKKPSRVWCVSMEKVSHCNWVGSGFSSLHTSETIHIPIISSHGLDHKLT